MTKRTVRTLGLMLLASPLILFGCGDNGDNGDAGGADARSCNRQH